MRNFTSASSRENALKKDIHILGLSQGFIDSNFERSWYHFRQLCDQKKLELLTGSQLSELLRTIKLGHFTTSISQEVYYQMSLILQVMELYGHKLNEADLRHCIAVYTKLGKYGESRIIWDILIREYQCPELQSYTTFAMCLNYENKPNEVIQLLEQVNRAGIRTNHKFLLCVLEAYGDLRQGDKVILIYREIIALTGDTLNKEVFYRVLLALLKCEPTYFNFIPQIFDKMLENNLTLTEKHFSRVIRNYAFHGLVTEAAFWFSKMKKFGIIPTMSIYLNYLARFSRTSLPEKLVPLLSDSEYLYLMHLGRSIPIKCIDSVPEDARRYKSRQAFLNRLEYIRSKSSSSITHKPQSSLFTKLPGEEDTPNVTDA